MSGTTLTVGQFAELSAAVLKALPRDMSPADALAWAQNGKKLTESLRSVLSPLAISIPAVKPKLLALRSTSTVGPLLERFDPKVFFQTRKGLYVWNDFRRVLSSSLPLEADAMVKLVSFDLTRNTYDREIKAELPERHEVELWHIAKLIEAQPKGEDGPLLNNGYANIFYVGGFVVCVRWDAASSQWSVRDWELDDVRWSAGRRAFSRN